MTGVGRTDGLDLSETVGAYFRPGSAASFFDLALSDLADSAVAVWRYLGNAWFWFVERAGRLERSSASTVWNGLY
jgi:hypothetical protein